MSVYIPPADYTDYDNNVSVTITSKTRLPSRKQPYYVDTVSSYASIKLPQTSEPGAVDHNPSSTLNSNYVDFDGIPQNSGPGAVSIHQSPSDEPGYLHFDGGSHTSSTHIYHDPELPKKGSHSNPVVIFAVVAVIVLLLLAAGGSTMYFTVLKDNNPTTGAQEGKSPVNGVWGPWQEWSNCSATCGDGIMTRSRICDDPPPLFGGNECEGSAVENQSCKLTDCPVNGNWSEWLDWSDCSTSCDNGTRTRNRTCDNPVPAFGGDHCDGNNTDSEACMIKHCPVDGNWSAWLSWGDCSTTCGGGIKNRTRVCDNPAPKHNGQDCEGHTFETSVCNDVTCPPPGIWSAWSEWNDCSTSCGPGISSRVRTCDDSAGGECIGADLETKVCQKLKCYDSWGEWSACSFSCGSGIRTRNRTCDGVFTGQECGWHFPTFQETKICMNSVSCTESFCASRNGSCSYNHPNRCDLYITCDENKNMFERPCNVLMRYKVRVDDECKGDCDWAANVPCSV